MLSCIVLPTNLLLHADMIARDHRRANSTGNMEPAAFPRHSAGGFSALYLLRFFPIAGKHLAFIGRLSLLLMEPFKLTAQFHIRPSWQSHRGSDRLH